MKGFGNAGGVKVVAASLNVPMYQLSRARGGGGGGGNVLDYRGLRSILL